jgi:hypothetical protein
MGGRQGFDFFFKSWYIFYFLNGIFLKFLGYLPHSLMVVAIPGHVDWVTQAGTKPAFFGPTRDFLGRAGTKPASGHAWASPTARHELGGPTMHEGRPMQPAGAQPSTTQPKRTTYKNLSPTDNPNGLIPFPPPTIAWQDKTASDRRPYPLVWRLQAVGRCRGQASPSTSIPTWEGLAVK